MKIDVNKIIEERLAGSMGLDRYADIMSRVNSINVSRDEDFQRQFNGFYKVRRNAAWRKIYYEVFETMKAERATFAIIIKTLFEKTGNIEASFSSKMLATLNPNKPIWDRYVVQNLNLKLTGKSKHEQLENAIALYAAIEEWYSEFLSTDDAKKCIAAFDRNLPKYTRLSDVKKVDFFLWSIR
ncbi:hypothetical protein [Lentibacillus saliphilus]|uniref:hypothetical protein n=1 Tax=Lentibacillus saliphilus TaxID=2737028 RepID=UPI001C30DFB2|nr:hypothetical protein [Lentibacillus saliphilus]